MNKVLKIVIGIFVIIFLITVVDIIAIFKLNRPLLALKKDEYMYSGLFYNTYNCQEFSAPVIKFKTVKFSCSVDTKNKDKIKDIVDKTLDIKDFVCAEVLENFYNDDKYKYYYSCLKGEYVVVIFEDGREKKVSEALQEGIISIDDLDSYGIKYYKYKEEYE